MSNSQDRRRRLVAGLTILLMFSALVVSYHLHTAREGSARVAAGPPLLRPSPLTIVPGIHMLGGLQPAAAYVVETSEELVLIDSGLERDAGPLKSEMARLRLDWTRLHAILLTHVHA